MAQLRLAGRALYSKMKEIRIGQCWFGLTLLAGIKDLDVVCQVEICLSAFSLQFSRELFVELFVKGRFGAPEFFQVLSKEHINVEIFSVSFVSLFQLDHLHVVFNLPRPLQILLI